MWSEKFTHKGGFSPPPANIGKTILFGGTIVATLLGGSYMSLLRNKHKQERDGTNPIYEQIIAQANTKPITKEDVNSLPALSHSVRSLRTIPPPTKVHNAKHITIDDFYASGAHDTHERYQAPPPQRPKGDGSGRIYTKSPDYAKNYEKTRPRIANDQTGRV